MRMSGLLTFITINGVPIFMADGPGTLLSAGPGSLMNHGDGLSITMDAGTGEWVSAGIGYPPDSGGLLGSTGIGVMIISDGVL